MSHDVPSATSQECPGPLPHCTPPACCPATRNRASTGHPPLPPPPPATHDAAAAAAAAGLPPPLPHCHHRCRITATAATLPPPLPHYHHRRRPHLRGCPGLAYAPAAAACAASTPPCQSGPAAPTLLGPAHTPGSRKRWLDGRHGWQRSAVPGTCATRELHLLLRSCCNIKNHFPSAKLADGCPEPVPLAGGHPVQHAEL